MASFPHSFPFDPSYGHALETLLQITPPEPPPDFSEFWARRYRRACQVRPQPQWIERTEGHPAYRVYDLSYRSTDDFLIGGWLLLPRAGGVVRGAVIGHGYGGREQPDFDLPLADSALLFPCFRGISRSRHPSLPDSPPLHVLHHIDQRDHYVIGGCVDDLWVAVTVLLELFPQVVGHVAYLGISFGGGVGALALPWDPRIRLAHLNVPTFGHQALRVTLPTFGSAEAVRQYQSRHGNALDTLRYYDAASAALFSSIPVHVAAARFDPVVAPPGQFAIFNALPEPKQLFVLQAGHFDYPDRLAEERALREELATFFAVL